MASMASSDGIIWWHHLMALFDGSHHMMASIIHPSLDGIIRWFPSCDGFASIIWWPSSFDGSHHPAIIWWLCFHHLMAYIIWWLPSSKGIIRWHHPMASFDGSHHMMASIIHPSLDGIIRWFPSYDGFNHLDGSWLSSYDGSYHLIALIIWWLASSQASVDGSHH